MVVFLVLAGLSLFSNSQFLQMVPPIFSPLVNANSASSPDAEQRNATPAAVGRAVAEALA
jgi:hypothetical protein